MYREGELPRLSPEAYLDFTLDLVQKLLAGDNTH
jgi:hypothetical protein